MFAGFGTWAGLSEIWTLTAITFERCRAISSNNVTKLSSRQVRTLEKQLEGRGGFAQRLAFMLLDPAAPDSIPGISKKNISGKSGPNPMKRTRTCVRNLVNTSLF